MNPVNHRVNRAVDAFTFVSGLTLRENKEIKFEEN
jgi:hypothetical protein